MLPTYQPATDTAAVPPRQATLWRAMAGNPVRFLLSSWPWRSLVYVGGTLVSCGMAFFAALVLGTFPPALLLIGLPVGVVERWRLRIIERKPVADPHVPVPFGLDWVQRRVTEPATWRELVYAITMLLAISVIDLIALSVLGFFVLFLVIPLVYFVDGGVIDVQVFERTFDSMGELFLLAGVVGVPGTVLTLYGIGVLAGAQAEYAKWLLAPTDADLQNRVRELSQSRTRLVDAFEAERRRIERDLHDGAQQHLVLLTMKLGLAQVELAGQNTRAAALVGEAHQQARLALASMREHIRGIHPQILTDFGLVEAVRELAERCPLAVEVELMLPGRPPTPVESAAYFVISEALTNAVRHADASHVQVTGGFAEGRLLVAVIDDGHGGADPTRGTGLRGLADRVAVMDGTLEISSPKGGPTMIRIDLPCHFQ
ncbi:sensor histidine kinase [Virgisporangium ochraceum]|uniref:histidine kinase n=1 Tax=Virgisporangium ochraceum TaxID=65505 RepID=A0A8J4E846_9ACTN|nr:sensor histidine kinase [Virgisporangium ochraceum]GIJ65800.1 histidine kinase [Virgisporangium ochraceum]